MTNSSEISTFHSEALKPRIFPASKKLSVGEAVKGRLNCQSGGRKRKGVPDLEMIIEGNHEPCSSYTEHCNSSQIK
jgi:hypothetical protein